MLRPYQFKLKSYKFIKLNVDFQGFIRHTVLVD
jgi:hypothetical protein